MKNIITLLFVSFLFFFQLSFSQQLPIDFSDVSDNFLDWGGSAFKKVPSPTDSNNTVGEFFRANSSGGQGYYIDLAQPIDLDVENSIKIKFYAFDSNSHTVIVKLEREGNSSVELGVNCYFRGKIGQNYLLTTRLLVVVVLIAG